MNRKLLILLLLFIYTTLFVFCIIRPQFGFIYIIVLFLIYYLIETKTVFKLFSVEHVLHTFLYIFFFILLIFVAKISSNDYFAALYFGALLYYTLQSLVILKEEGKLEFYKFSILTSKYIFILLFVNIIFDTILMVL